MKKSAKPVIITLVVAVVLGGALALLLLLPEKQGETSSGSPALDSLGFLDDEDKETYPITAGKSSDLLTISVKNSLGEYTVTRCERGTDSSDTEYYHKVSGLGNVPQDDDAVTYLVDSLSTLLATDFVEQEPQDLSKYGLDNPAAEVSLDFDEGEDIVLQFGIRKPTDENSIYCMANDFVFLTDYYPIEDVFRDPLVFAQLVLTPKEGTVDDIRISRPDLEETVALRYLSEYDDPAEGLVVENDCKYAFTAPISLNVDPSKGKALYENLLGLEMSACEFTEQTETILKECGFDDPSAVVDFTLDGTEYTLTLGGKLPDGSGYYAIMSGAEGVFSLDVRSAVWARFELGDVVSRTPASPYIYACTSVEVTSAAGTFVFTNEDNKFTYQGKNVEGGGFTDFFNELISVPCDEFYTGQSNGVEVLKVRYTYSEKYAALYGRQYDELSYTDGDGRKYVLNLNGNAVFKVSAVYIQRVTDDLNALTSG